MMTLENLTELILAVALFFNPFGYNELFAYIMSHTGSYWGTACIFYVLSGSLFLVYFYLKHVGRKKKKKEASNFNEK